MLGHHEFAKEVWSRAPSLFSGTNVDGETPLIAALMAANLSLASDIITAASQYMKHDDLEKGRLLNCMLLEADRRKENALHHAMRNGFENFALKLLEIEPQLSEQVTNIGESPMYMAARRGYSEVVKQLLEIPSSADCGPIDESAMHAAVKHNHPGSLLININFVNVIFHTNYRLHMPPVLSGIVKQLLEGRPQLAYHMDKRGNSPLHRAVIENKFVLVNIFLEYDPNLARIKHESTGNTPFIEAVAKGYVSIAKEIMSTCPDSVYTPDKHGCNALHFAIRFEKPHLVDYILRTPQLHRLINQANNDGVLPLHDAACKCDPELLRSLLTHAGQDFTAVNVSGGQAVDVVYGQTTLWKTLKWSGLSLSFSATEHGAHSAFPLSLFLPARRKKRRDLISPLSPLCRTSPSRRLLAESADSTLFNPFFPPKPDSSLLLSTTQPTIIGQNSHRLVRIGQNRNESFTLLSNVIPSALNYLIRDNAKMTIQKEAIEKVQSLTTKYTSNTSLVAALLATITFAAAFTLPGGFSSDSSDAGQPLFARKAAFQVFLISDTIAMCSSLAVAFLCILETWEDLDFLLNYRKTTRALMWCAYGATAIAFGTGLFTVIAPKNLWLAILILVLCTILPLLSRIIGEWPLLMLRYRLGGLFKKDLVPFI
ncbi:uncharacterized protein LOC144546179 [Carex rostrata]